MCLFVVAPIWGQGNNDDRLNRLIAQAENKALQQDPYWLVLLHYEPSGNESEVDSPEFFLSPEGKENPKAELIETLKAFFPSTGNLAQEENPQCRFPARYAWLKSRLDFTPFLSEEQPCPKFTLWQTTIAAESMTLLFASYYLETSASMFGHTFIRINTKSSQKNPLFSYAVNFAVNIDTSQENPFYLSTMGLFGGYQANFSLLPFYVKVQEYSNIEARNLWEYNLNFTREEMARVVAHLWELKKAVFDYYFFDENCSYQLLSLLEVARPGLHFRDQFIYHVIPINTVRVVLREPGLVTSRIYRPSLVSSVRHQIDELGENEKELLEAMVQSKEPFYPAKWSELSQEQQARVLEVYSEVLLIQDNPQKRKLRYRVLSERALNPTIFRKKSHAPEPIAPEKGHATASWGTGIGQNQNGSGFLELESRVALHDLLASDNGFLPYSEVEFFKAVIRHFPDEKEQPWGLEEFTFYSAVSLSPRTRLTSPWAWKIKSGFERDRTKNCVHCPIFVVRGSFGVSYSIFDGVGYFLLNAGGGVGESIENHYRLGGGATIGLVNSPLQNWKIFAEATQWYYYPISEKNRYAEYQFGTAWHISTNQDIRLLGRKTGAMSELSLKWIFYY